MGKMCKMAKKRRPIDSKIKLVGGKPVNVNKLVAIKQAASGEKPKVTLPKMSWDK